MWIDDELLGGATVELAVRRGASSRETTVALTALAMCALSARMRFMSRRL